MIKKDKSLVALTLGIAISSQNTIISSALQSQSDATLLSDDEFKIKVNTNANPEETETSEEYQMDPEESKNYSMGGSYLIPMP